MHHYMAMSDKEHEYAGKMRKLNKVIREIREMTSRGKWSCMRPDRALNTTMSVLPPLSVIRNFDRRGTSFMFDELKPEMCLVHYEYPPKHYVTSPYGKLKERSNRCDSGISLWDPSSPREAKLSIRSDSEDSSIVKSPELTGPSAENLTYANFPGYRKCSTPREKSFHNVRATNHNKNLELKYYDSDTVSCTSMEVAAILKDAPGPTIYFSNSRRKKSRHSKNMVIADQPTTPLRRNKLSKTPIYMTMSKPNVKGSSNSTYVNMKSFQPVRKEARCIIKPRSLSNFVEQSLESFLQGLDISRDRESETLNYSDVLRSNNKPRAHSRNSQGSQESGSSNSTLCDSSEFCLSLHALKRTHTLHKFTINYDTCQMDSITIKNATLSLESPSGRDCGQVKPIGQYDHTVGHTNVVRVDKVVYSVHSHDTYYMATQNNIQTGDILVEISGTNVLGYSVEQVEQILVTEEDHVHLVVGRKTLSQAF